MHATLRRDVRRNPSALRTGALLRWLVAAAVPVAVPLLAAASPAPGGRRPQNVLLILMDDVGVDVLSSYGLSPDTATTPNIDALAATGVTFRNAWANPLCTPSRACLLTGVYGFRTGIGSLLHVADVGEYELDPNLTTLPEMLELGGNRPYQTAAIGKWHLGHDLQSPNLFGFDHYAGPLWNLADVAVLPGTPYFSYEKVVNGQAVHSTSYATVDQVDDALAWIGGASGPWFVYLAFSAAHTPLHVPPAGLYSNPNLVNCNGAQKRACFKALVEAIDSELGRLLAGIDQHTLARTTVMLLADNGSSHNVMVPPFDPARGKGSVYQEGVNVPLIVKSPLVTTPGASSDALVSIADVYATIADLARVDLHDPARFPPGTAEDSVSFYRNIVDPARPSPRAYLFSEVFAPNGVGSGLPPQAPATPVCETDIGYQGPGSVTLAFCGDFLDLGNRSNLFLSGAPPAAPVKVYMATEVTPTPNFGGVVVAWPPEATSSFVTDGSGALDVPGFFSTSVAGFNVPRDYYYQAVVADPAQPAGFQVSNAVHVHVAPSQLRAIRNQCYKLITTYGSPRHEELYDLCADPFERIDLLASGPPVPGTAVFANYAALRSELDNLVQ